MQKVLGFLVTLLVAGFTQLVLAQEEVRTPEELAKLPIYERLLEGDDAQKTEELEESYDAAIEAEDWSGAKQYAQSLLDVRIAKQGADHYEVTDARQMLQMVETLSKLTRDERRQLAEVRQQDQQLVKLYQQGQFQKAAQIGERVLAMLKNLLGENNPDYAASLNNLALLYEKIGDHAMAEPLYLKARDLYKMLLGENHPEYSDSLNNLAVLYRSLGDYAKAELLFVQQCNLTKKLQGENHPDYATCLNDLAGLYTGGWGSMRRPSRCICRPATCTRSCWGRAIQTIPQA